MNEHRSWPERNRPTIAKGPFAAVAIGGTNITVDIEAAPVVRSIVARAVHQVRAPQSEAAGLEEQVDRVVPREAYGGERLVAHRRTQRMFRRIHMKIAAKMTTRNEAH